MVLTNILLGIAIVLLVVVLFVVILRTGASSYKYIDDMQKLLDDTEDRVSDRVSANVLEIRKDINERLRMDSEENRKNRVEVSDMISRGQEKLEKNLRESSDGMQKTIKESMTEMQNSNKEKLSEIQGEINKKLDVSLNERLDASFKNVGEQLNKLYVSLGELAKLEDGVSSLNKTLSNVKTRGIYGETQLENILANILTSTLYDKNVVTKTGDGANRDAVEFAIKIPDKEVQGSYMYLPIDSKFPATIYEKIREASEKADADALQKAVKELEQHVKNDAKDIHDKYLDPPNTTDFGIMFLPTESLYAEVLRIPGLVEECQQKYHVVITGPTTVAALLNSLSIGFRYMAVNKHSQNILKLLSAIKSQYKTLSSLIETAENRIDLAKKATNDLQHRADIINKRLSSVEEIDPIEARDLLGITEEA